jgi:hypothetical protein
MGLVVRLIKLVTRSAYSNPAIREPEIAHFAQCCRVAVSGGARCCYQAVPALLLLRMARLHAGQPAGSRLRVLNVRASIAGVTLRLLH